MVITKNIELPQLTICHQVFEKITCMTSDLRTDHSILGTLIGKHIKPQMVHVSGIS